MTKSKKICKVLIVLIFAIMILSSFTSVFAAGDEQPKVADGTDKDQKTYQPAEFSTSGKIDTTTGVKDVKSVAGKIVGLIRVVGTISAIGILIVLGIKYMMGSAEEKAEYKKTLFPYFIGAVFLFAASNLATVVYSWASKL